MLRPIAPSSSPTSTNPEDKKAWSNYYAECETYVDMNKPGMDRNW